MPTIDVTAFVQSFDMYDFAHSAFEHDGRGSSAGEATWQAALALAKRAYGLPCDTRHYHDEPAEVLALCMLVTPATRDEIESWLRGFGAWDRAELASMSDPEMCALVFRFIAGGAREMLDAAEGDCGAFDKAAYEKWCENNASNLWCEDPTDADAKWTLYVGI